MYFTFSYNNSLDDRFPSSPQEDLGSQRLSRGNLVQKLTVIKRINQRLADKDHRSWNSDTGSVTDMSMISESDSGLFYSPLEESLCAHIVKTIVESLSDATDTVLCCSKLVLPDPLLHNISRELLHLAASEPCGLKGALIDLCVEQGDQQGELCSVEQIAVDHNLVPTFHLTLVLRPEVGGLWPKVQRLFGGRKAVSPQRQSGRHTLRLSTGFRAIKRKLYSSGELLVEEC
ncbi:DNA damage-inducible transcript 4 protein [Oncorhynchus mykiss]|uniref:DNA damage-inducible transcript 4 protein n=1 Tax=Oncorhynchus mykiss TaxID=8022 RepID=A0A8C7WLH9_ONCMY|nr:DNA damage-inducible transcript 4 protein [Oncorhynchus mykiss]